MRTPRAASASSTIGPMAATRTRARPSRNRASAPAAARHLPETIDLRRAGERDGVDTRFRQRRDQIARPPRRRSPRRRRRARRSAPGRPPRSRKSHQRPVRLLAVELDADPPPAQVERAQLVDHACARWAPPRADVGRKADLLQRARRLRPAGDLRARDSAATTSARRPMRSAAASSRRSPSPVRKMTSSIPPAASAPQPAFDRPLVGASLMADQRAAQRLRALGRQQLGQTVELAGLGKRDGAADKRRAMILDGSFTVRCRPQQGTSPMAKAAGTPAKTESEATIPTTTRATSTRTPTTASGRRSGQERRR